MFHNYTKLARNVPKEWFNDIKLNVNFFPYVPNTLPFSPKTEKIQSNF